MIITVGFVRSYGQRGALYFAEALEFIRNALLVILSEETKFTTSR